MVIRKYRLFLCAVLALATATGAAAVDPRITPTASSDREFAFVCTFTSDLNDLIRFDITDSTSVPGRVVQVAVPHGAEVRLVSIAGADLQPLGAGGLPVGLTTAAPLAELAAPRLVRGRRLVAVRINPVRPDGVYGSVHVRLAFDGGRGTTSLEPANDPEFEALFNASIANWEEAQHWPVTTRRSSLRTSSTAAASLSAASQWYKVLVNSTGLHRISGADLQSAGISLTNLRSDSLRLFNAGGRRIPAENAEERPEFREVALLVLDGGDGLFGASDQLVFYGEAVDRWLYRAGLEPRWLNNRYTSANVYWLAVSGDFPEAAMRMVEADGAPTGTVDTVVTTARHLVHIEQERIISKEYDGHIKDYFTWYWTDSTAVSVFAATPGASAAETTSVSVVARTDGSGSTGGYVDLILNGASPIAKDCNRYNCVFTATGLRSGGLLNELRLSLDSVYPAGGIPPYLDYVEIRYAGQLQPTSNVFEFWTAANAAVAEFQVVDNFSGVPTILDIADPLRPRILAGYARSGGLVRFNCDLSSAAPQAFHLAQLSAARSPLSITATSYTDLRAASAQTDLIIITPRQLVSAMDEYLAYRQADGHAIRVVATEDVMDNFGFGLYDPAAIRDFLNHAYHTWPSPAPSCVLLAGDANYDYRGYLDVAQANLVPSFIRENDWTAGDDNFVYFGEFGLLDNDTSYLAPGDRGYDMMTARWPVHSAAEIDLIVDKIKTYESADGLGAWRSRVTFVADDEYSGDNSTESYHTTQTETLEKERLPRQFLRQKIYLWEYPFVNRRKPAVNDAVVQAFNNGALVVNYVGHGNPDVWAHEHVLERTSDLPRISNLATLPLLFVASCAIGFFDDPTGEGMAEDLLTLTSGGAIGVISAMRLVYSGPNATFNRDCYRYLFGGEPMTINEALYAAKLERQYPGPRPSDNDRAYTYMGDPYQRLAIPQYEVEYTERPDSLVALKRTRVAGRLVDTAGQTVAQDGELAVVVYDTDQPKVHYVGDVAIEYAVAGAMLFRGTASVSGGEFAFDFVAPLDVSYGAGAARVSTYARLSNADGLGMIDSLRIGEGLVTSTDSAGPLVTYTVAGRTGFGDGSMAARTDWLTVTLIDSSGINLSGSLGHGITLVIDDDVEAAKDLTALFAYDRDDYTTGSLSFRLSEMPLGEHRFKLRAWDNANNVSIEKFTLHMVEASSMAIRDLLNYPNPMSDATTFYFELPTAARQFAIEVFTLSGKAIWRSTHWSVAAGTYPNSDLEVSWDGRDADGDRVATGVYIYRAMAVPDEGETIEEFGKIVVVN